MIYQQLRPNFLHESNSPPKKSKKQNGSRMWKILHYKKQTKAKILFINAYSDSAKCKGLKTAMESLGKLYFIVIQLSPCFDHFFHCFQNKVQDHLEALMVDNKLSKLKA